MLSTFPKWFIFHAVFILRHHDLLTGGEISIEEFDDRSYLQQYLLEFVRSAISDRIPLAVMSPYLQQMAAEVHNFGDE